MSEHKEQRKVTAKPPPQVLALVVCDAIWRDPGTNKAFLLGTFSVIQSATYPATHGDMAFYVALTGGHGKVRLNLRLVDVDEERAPIVECSGEAVFSDPRLVLEIILGTAGVVFPAAGEYRFQLFAGDELLLERRIVALQEGAKPNEAKAE